MLDAYGGRILEGGESRLRLDHLDAARRRTADTDGIPEFLGHTYVVPQFSVEDSRIVFA